MINMEIKKFVVIGGQYEQHCYGTTDSLRAAKVMATKNAEYWDNWQGWHTPAIYRGEDCKIINARGMITIRDGAETIVHGPEVSPVCVFDGIKKRWVSVDDE